MSDVVVLSSEDEADDGIMGEEEDQVPHTDEDQVRVKQEPEFGKFFKL